MDFPGVCLSQALVQTPGEQDPAEGSWRLVRCSWHWRERLCKLSPNSDAWAGWRRATDLPQWLPWRGRGDGGGCAPARGNLLHTQKHLQAIWADTSLRGCSRREFSTAHLRLVRSTDWKGQKSSAEIIFRHPDFTFRHQDFLPRFGMRRQRQPQLLAAIRALILNIYVFCSSKCVGATKAYQISCSKVIAHGTPPTICFCVWHGASPRLGETSLHLQNKHVVPMPTLPRSYIFSV